MEAFYDKQTDKYLIYKLVLRLKDTGVKSICNVKEIFRTIQEKISKWINSSKQVIKEINTYINYASFSE